IVLESFFVQLTLWKSGLNQFRNVQTVLAVNQSVDISDTNYFVSHLVQRVYTACSHTSKSLDDYGSAFFSAFDLPCLICCRSNTVTGDHIVHLESIVGQLFLSSVM